MMRASVPAQPCVPTPCSPARAGTTAVPAAPRGPARIREELVPMTAVEGRVAIVTGGASGIGLGIATALHAAGARLVLADIESDRLHRAAATLGAHPVVVDVRDPDDLVRLREESLGVHGQVDILVNNAGVGPVSRIRDLTLEDWRWMLDVNLLGVVHGIHAFLPLLLANPDGGHIVTTSSMAALGPTTGVGAYTAAKCAATGLMEVLDLELREDDSAVRTTVLVPGTVRTDIARSQRNRPGGAHGGLHDVDIAEGPGADLRWMSPEEVGTVTVRAILADDLYAITHPDWWPLVEDHQRTIRTAFDRYPVLGTEARHERSPPSRHRRRGLRRSPDRRVRPGVP